MPALSALVRWDSALPVRLAFKRSPDGVQDNYLIFVGGLPAMGNPAQSSEDQGVSRFTGRLKSVTSLERKGKDPIFPERVEAVSISDEKGIMFAFPRNPDPVTITDKEVTFVAAMGPLRIKVRFNLKEMMNEGHLEL